MIFQIHWYQQHDPHDHHKCNGLPNNSSWSPNWNNQDEFAGPKELADYLLKLDKDDEAYNQYFKWKVRRLSILSSTLVFCTEPQGHPIDWLESLCLNHYDVDKRQKILVSSSVHGIAHLYDQCCFQGTHTHTHDVSRVRGSLSTPGSSAECVLWCITHRFVLINMILVSWFSSSLSWSVGSHHHYLGQLVLLIIILVIIWMILNHISPTFDTLLTYVSLDQVYKVTGMDVKFSNFHD